MENVTRQLVQLQTRMAALEQELADLKQSLQSVDHSGGGGTARLSDCIEDPDWVKALPRDSRKAIIRILGVLTNYSVNVIQKKAKDLAECGHDAGEVLMWALNAHRNGKYPMSLFLRNLDLRPRMGSAPWGPRRTELRAGPSDADLETLRKKEDQIRGVPENESNRQRLIRLIQEYRDTNMTMDDAWMLLEKAGAKVPQDFFKEAWAASP